MRDTGSVSAKLGVVQPLVLQSEPAGRRALRFLFLSVCLSNEINTVCFKVKPQGQCCGTDAHLSVGVTKTWLLLHLCVCLWPPFI